MTKVEELRRRSMYNTSTYEYLWHRKIPAEREQGDHKPTGSARATIGTSSCPEMEKNCTTTPS